MRVLLGRRKQYCNGNENLLWFTYNTFWHHLLMNLTKCLSYSWNSFVQQLQIMYEYYMGGSWVIQNHILGMEVGEYHMLAPKTTTSYLHDLQFHLLYQEGMPLNIHQRKPILWKFVVLLLTNFYLIGIS